MVHRVKFHRPTQAGYIPVTVDGRAPNEEMTRKILEVLNHDIIQVCVTAVLSPEILPKERLASPPADYTTGE